jgi:membrane protease subunit HflK
MALNDPQWGRRGNDGPPDLDELWNRFKQKLPGMGGRGGGRGGGDGRQFRGGGLILIALVIIVWLASGFYIVDASQRGIVLRFGKHVQTTQPGPQWHLPYPVESVEIVNLAQVRTVEVGYRNNVKNKVLKESLMLTDDENIIDLQFAVQYLLSDPGQYLFNNRQPPAGRICNAGRRIGDARDRRQEPHGLRAVRGTRADRRLRAKADAADSRPLPDRHRHQPRHHAAGAAT